MASVIAASTLALAVSIPLPPSSPLTASNNARPRFNLGGPPSRRSSLIACNHRQSIEGNTTTIDNNLEQDLESSCTTHRASSIPRIIRTGSDSKSSTTSSSLPNFTSPATSYACRRSDSGSFSESGFSEPTSTTSGIAELSRATSCAHPECVMAPPCERMIELSGILSWPSPSSAQAFSVPSSGQGNDSAPRRDLMILDNACGASALVTNQLINILPIELMEEAQLVATDVSAGVIAEATRRIAETDWADHIFTYKMAQEHMLGLDDASFTHVFTNFAIHLSKDVEATFKEMKRILMPGGICAFTVWKHLPWLEILAKAIKEEYPKRPMPFPCHEDAILSLTRWNRWHDPEWIKKTIQEAGFTCIPDNKEDENGTDDDEGRTQNVGMNDKDEDWSQYEFNSGQSRSLSRKNSRTSSPTPSMETDSSATPTQSNPIPSSLDPLETEESSILIEEVSSIHRYTKHEFMSNFGTSVLDHLISSSWGKQSISKEETRKELTEALLRYLIKLCPDQFDEIELEMKALVVIVRKVNKKDTSKHI